MNEGNPIHKLKEKEEIAIGGEGGRKAMDLYSRDRPTVAGGEVQPRHRIAEGVRTLMHSMTQSVQGSNPPSLNAVRLRAKGFRASINHLRTGIIMMVEMDRHPEDPFIEALSSFNKKAKQLRKSL